MTGTLTAPVVKDGRTVTRALAPDRVVRTVDGGSVRLPGPPCCSCAPSVTT